MMADGYARTPQTGIYRTVIYAPGQTQKRRITRRKPFPNDREVCAAGMYSAACEHPHTHCENEGKGKT